MIRRRRRSGSGGAVNRPGITVPGAQAILLSSAPLIFATSISVSDAVETSLTVQLTFTGGTITLDGTTGLSFSVGDGTADATMTFSGTITNINNALSGMSVTAGSTGDRTLSIIATNTTGSNSSSVAVQFGAIPVFTVDPAISGDLDYGNTLTCSNGTVTGYPTPTLTKQWQNGGSNISGQTGDTWLSAFADVGDTITCEVTATNAYGSDMAEATGVVITDPSGFNISDLNVSWVSITNVEVGYVDGEIEAGDFLEFQTDTVNTFDSGNLEEVSEELDAGEIAGGSFEAILPPLGAGDWYIRVRVRRGVEVSAWSATDLIDYAAPTISSTTPADNATGVAIANNITITFNENVAFGTGNITLRKNDGGWTDVEAFNVATEVGTGAGQVSISGAVLTINPTSDLLNSKEYAIRIDATAIDDTAGNSFAGIANDTTFSFTTVAASVWSPNNLWVGGEAGGWGDASILASLKQSNAGVTDVAADSDVVGYWLDQGPNAHALTSGGNDTTRPVYKTSGGLHWVEFDGSNDGLRKASNVGLYAAGSCTVLMAVRANPATGRHLFNENNTASQNSRYDIIRSHGTTATSQSQLVRDQAATIAMTGIALGTNHLDNTDNVVGAVDDGSNFAVYLDGSQTATASYTRPGVGLIIDQLQMGGLFFSDSLTLPQFCMAARVYAWIAIGRVLSGPEIAAATTWLGAKMGRTL